MSLGCTHTLQNTCYTLQGIKQEWGSSEKGSHSLSKQRSLLEVCSLTTLDSVSYPNVHPTNQVFHLNWPKLVFLTTKRLTANEKPNISQCLLCIPMKSRFQLKFHKSQKILQNSNSKPNMVKFISYVQKERERKLLFPLMGLKNVGRRFCSTKFQHSVKIPNQVMHSLPGARKRIPNKYL